jgi:hypothetical protein
MSVTAMISGRIRGKVSSRPTDDGGTITQFKLRVPNGKLMEFWNVSTYDRRAPEEFASLDDGDGIAATGSLHLELFDFAGGKRIKRSLIATRIIALKPPTAAHLEAEINAIEEAQNSQS